MSKYWKAKNELFSKVESRRKYPKSYLDSKVSIIKDKYFTKDDNWDLFKATYVREFYEKYEDK